jgi:hypothetical protein
MKITDLEGRTVCYTRDDKVDAKLAQARAVMAVEQQKLLDRNAVMLNLLRGTIATPSLDQLAHAVPEVQRLVRDRAALAAAVVLLQRALDPFSIAYRIARTAVGATGDTGHIAAIAALYVRTSDLAAASEALHSHPGDLSAPLKRAGVLE